MVSRHIAEEGDLVLDALVQRMLGAAHDDVRLDAHALQILDAGLGGLCLHLLGCPQVGDEGDVDEDDIFPSLLVLELPDGLQEGLALNVAYRAAHLDNGNLCILCDRIAVEAALDLVRDVGDHLYGASAEIAPPFLLQDRPVDLACGHIGILCEALVDKALIVAQIQVRLRPVVCDKDLSVLYRVHGSRVDVDIGIKLLHGHRIPSRLQEPAKGCGCDALAKSRYYAACHKYIFYCHSFLLLSVRCFVVHFF